MPEPTPRVDDTGGRPTQPAIDLRVDPDVEPQDHVEPVLFAHLLGRVSRLLADSWDVLAVISIGGAIGSLGRWATSVAWPGDGSGFPWPTVQVNVLGCALLGLLMVMVRRHSTEGRYVRPFLGVGVLGGYTTFSTYALDVHALVLERRPVLAGAYLAGTVLAGLFAVWTGVTLGRLLTRAMVEEAR